MATAIVLRETSGPKVLIWTLSLDGITEAWIAGWRAMLDPTELARADGFVFPRHRVQYIAAHALLRAALSATVPGPHPADWRFVAGPNGKPAAWLNGWPAPLSFNLSHTDGFVGVATVPQGGCALGFDLEPLDCPVTLDIAGHHFRVEEVAWLTALAEDRRNTGFLQLWTLKEAFIKATGEGLSRDLASFWFTPSPPRLHFATSPDRPSPSERAEDWHFEQRVVAGRFIGAVGLCAPGRTSLAADWIKVTADQAAGPIVNIVS
jgi:4'-phosphopantetheinyl transferase